MSGNTDAVCCHTAPGVVQTVSRQKGRRLYSHVDGIVHLLKRVGHTVVPAVVKTKVMSYHDIGAVKWKNIGTSYLMRDVKVPSKKQIAQWRSTAE